MLFRSCLRIFAIGIAGLIIGCGPADPVAAPAGEQTAAGVASEENPPPAAPPASGGQFIRMHVDGVEWMADREIFCANAPAGINPMLVVSGSFGPKDANEQVFNLNLSNVQGPGTLHLVGGGSLTHVIQLANLDQSRYLNGGAMGFDVKVEIIEFTRDPTHIELRFDGTLNSSAGTPLRIEHGHVRCSE
jgi:hypothetical protein